MAKQIIITNQVKRDGYFELSYVFWLISPTKQQPIQANTGATSAYRAATPDELLAIQSGVVLEQIGIASYGTGTDTPTIESDLQNRYTLAQNTLNADKKFTYYGSYFDGTVWTITGA